MKLTVRLTGSPARGVSWARELLAAADAGGDDGEGGTLADAKRFLADLLADGPLLTKVIKADAEGAGYSWVTIRRAKDALDIKASKTGMRGGWEWALPAKPNNPPEGAQKRIEGAQQKGMSFFVKDEHLRSGSGQMEVEV